MNQDLNNAIPFAINIATAANHTIIAASSGNKHRIWRLFLWANGTVSVTFKSGTTLLSGPIAMTAQTHIPLPLQVPELPHFITTAGEAFIITLSDAVQVSGFGTASTG